MLVPDPWRYRSCCEIGETAKESNKDSFQMELFSSVLTKGVLQSSGVERLATTIPVHSQIPTVKRTPQTSRRLHCLNLSLMQFWQGEKMEGGDLRFFGASRLAVLLHSLRLPVAVFPSQILLRHLSFICSAVHAAPSDSSILIQFEVPYFTGI